MKIEEKQLKETMEIDRKMLEHSFEQVKSSYRELQGVEISLRFRNEWFFTMRSFIKLNSIFSKKRKYGVNVNWKGRKDVLSQASRDHITARFAHEMAHIIEYEKMSNSELLLFTFKYAFNLKFRFLVERRVNAFVVNNGFAKELFVAWRDFLSLDGVSKRYKKYIAKNYPPRWEDIKDIAQKQGISEAMYQSIQSYNIN